MWIKVKDEDDDCWYIVNTDRICCLEEDKRIRFEKFSLYLTDASFNKLERLIKYV